LILWLTGLPCSGKTTLGSALAARLKESGHPAELLDGDAIRRELWPELGFAMADRSENVMRFGFLARMLASHGIIPVVCTVSPYRAARDLVRHESSGFLEIYVNAPLEICERRDVKSMYRKARAGDLPGFTGVFGPYEPPLAPEVECRTDLLTVEECVAKIMELLAQSLPCGIFAAGSGI
jgi:adenylyl-sulfate kinase